MDSQRPSGPWKGRAFAFTVGTLTAVLLLEIGLRVLGAGHVADRDRDELLERPSGADAVVLCVGDSWTEGVGAPEGRGYPGQLQQRFDAAGRSVVVVNLGLSAQNSTQMLDRLPLQLSRLRPDLVILLSGHANQWNHHGGRSYLRRHTRWATATDLMSRLRVVQLVRALRYFGRPARRDDDAGTGTEHEVDGVEQQMWALRDHERYDDALALLDGSIARCADDAPELTTLLCHRAHVLFIVGREAEADQAMACVLTRSPYTFDELLLVAEFHALRHDDEAAADAYLGAIAVHDPGVPLDLQECSDVARVLFATGHHEQAAAFFEAAALRSPCAREMAEVARARGRAGGDDWQLAMTHWAVTDLAEAVAWIRAHGADTLLHDYPASYEPYASHAGQYSAAVSTLAGDLDVPFVSHLHDFDRLVARDASRDRWFAADGHCNDAGYGQMADALFDEIERRGLLE